MMEYTVCSYCGKLNAASFKFHSVVVADCPLTWSLFHHVLLIASLRSGTSLN